MPTTKFFNLSIALAGFALAGATLAMAQTPDTYSLDDLRRAESARDEAQARLEALESSSRRTEREISEIDADLIVAAAEGRRREEAAARAEIRLGELGVEMEAARQALAGDEKTMEDLTASLMMLSSRRPPALAVSPDDIGEAIRAAILMGQITPALADRANDLRTRIETLNRLRDSIEQEQQILSVSDQAVAARRQQISLLSQEKRIARTSISAEFVVLRAETQRLAGRADTLRDLLDGLEKVAPSTPGRKPATARADVDAALKRLTPTPGAALPVAPSGAGAVRPALGTTLVKFGQQRAGVRQAGLTLATRASAQVVSPADARVEFSGLFRSYGEMLILDVGNDMLVIVSGLDEIYPEAGQWILAGEPIGHMTDRKTPPPELYLEVRRNGQPIDPESWLDRDA